MTQLHVNPYYHFSEEYYTALAERTNLAVALSWFGDELVGGHLFLADRQFAHYHLGGTSEKGLHLNSPTLLINAGAQWARERGCELLHLGGGGDGVFGYKRSYGGPIFRYHSLDVVADEPRYRNLVERRVDDESLRQGLEGFFPLYRA
jgi:lipid II:glycine glycyltransferase (peptidoglycan interpeptide bridge formation enzyme)